MARVEKAQDAAAELGAVVCEQDASGVTVVRLVGEIDISNAGEVGAALDGIIERSPDDLVIDLSALEFMDSSGLAVLLRAADRSGSIEVRNPSEVVRRIIECTGLADVLRLDS